MITDLLVCLQVAENSKILEGFVFLEVSSQKNRIFA